MTNAEAFAAMLLTPAQKAYRRSKVLSAEREEKAKRTAALIAFTRERQAWREAQEKAAAERKANGVKLTFEEWKAAVAGE